MAKIHTLTYNGTKSSDLGVFVTGSGSFDAAELDVDKYEIPGRNGDLILSNNRYKNIEITYPAFIPKAFMDKAQNVRNWLRSSRVYARLEDTYDTDHYRLGIPTGVQSFEPANRNDGANFEMTFDCKPQRFLKSGETPETVEADVQTESGEIVTFETIAESPMTSAEVSLSPIQDLNGYDSPWPGGGGKNKLPYPYAETTKTTNGVTFTVAADGTVTVNGTATANASIALINNAANEYSGMILSGSPSGATAATAAIAVQYWNGGAFSSSAFETGNGLTLTASDTIIIFVRVNNGATINNMVFKPMIRAAGTDASFAPYSNICPISGHAGAELYRTGKNLASISMESYNATQIISNLFALKKGTYTISFDYEGTPTYGVYLREGRQVASSIKTAYNVNNITFTLNTDYDNLYFSVYYANGIAPTELSNIMVELGSSATAYEAPQIDTYSVTFSDQGTVYGGTVDFVSGKLTVDRAMVDLGTLSWTKGNRNRDDTGYVFSTNEISATISRDYANINAVCSAFAQKLPRYSFWEYLAVGQFQVEPTGIIVFVADYSDAASFKTAMSGVQFVYELATPLEYTLSPQQIETLLGQNNVWSDAGPITLTYAEPFTIENPTIFDARPLFTVTNPAEGDVIMVNGQAITFVDGYSGTVFIDCETMNAYSGAANLNSIIEATDFPVLVPGTNIITWTGTGVCTMTPRWWEL